MPYSDVLPKLPPPPLQGPWAQKYFGVVGARMDAIIARFRDATFSRLPDSELAASDSLDEIGRVRKLPRGPGETDATYAERLQRAWDLWAGDNTPVTGAGGGAGSHLGMLNAISAAGIPTGPNGATIVQQNGRYAQLDVGGNLVLGLLDDCVNRLALDGTPMTRPGWTFDGRDNFYSVFGIVFPQSATFEAALLNAAVEQWRPSKALYVGAWIIETGVALGWPLGQTLGAGPPLGGNVITFVPGASRDDLRIGYYAL
jgi:hypothetical protein